MTDPSMDRSLEAPEEVILDQPAMAKGHNFFQIAGRAVNGLDMAPSFAAKGKK